MHLDEGTGDTEEDALTKVRCALWGMLYVDDAGIVSRSSEGLENDMTVVVEVYEAFSLAVSENKTESMRLPTRVTGSRLCASRGYSYEHGFQDLPIYFFHCPCTILLLLF